MRKRTLTLFLLLVCVALAFATSAGPTLAGTGGTSGGCDGGTTFCWSNPSNITANDGTFATVLLATGGASNELQGTNFGFSIAAGSTINGITVEIFKKTVSGVGAPADVDVTILKGGAATGSNLGHTGIGNTWLSAGGIDTYGGSTTLWGTAWAPSNINASSFGVQISCNEVTGSSSTTAGVDFMRITVTFTPPPGGGHRIIQTQIRNGILKQRPA